jgi:hypothetical protein
MITINLMTMEFIRLLSNHDANLTFKKGFGNRQAHVDTLISNKELEITLDDLSEKILMPCAYSLSEYLKRVNAKFCYSINIPDKRYECSIHKYDEYCIRGLIDKKYIYWEDNKEKITNCVRFDIMWS